MNLSDGSPLARAIASGFTNGYETYDDMNEALRLKMDMAANAVVAHLIQSTNAQMDAFSRIIDPTAYYEMNDYQMAKARETARSIVKCLWMGSEPESAQTKVINPYPVTTPSYQIVVRELTEDEQ